MRKEKSASRSVVKKVSRANGPGLSFGDYENVLKLDVPELDGCVTLNLLKTTEVFISTEWILCCMNCVSVKLLLNKMIIRGTRRFSHKTHPPSKTSRN